MRQNRNPSDPTIPETAVEDKRPTKRTARKKTPDVTIPKSATPDVTEEPSISPEAPAPKRGGLRKRAELRQARAEESAAAMDAVKRRSGLNEDDVAMMFALGYDSELGRTVGYDAVKKLKYQYLREERRRTSFAQIPSFGDCGEEEMSKEARADCLALYARQRKFLILRVLLTALSSILLLFSDLPSLGGNVLADLALENRTVLSFAGLAVLFLTSLLSVSRIEAGLAGCFRFRPNAYSVVGTMIPAVLIYDVVSLILQSEDLLPFNFAACLLLLITALCDTLKFAQEFRIFRLLSTDAVKTVLESTEPRKKKLRQGARLMKILNDDIDERFYSVRKTTSVGGLFRRFGDTGDFAGFFGVFLTLSFGASILFGIAVSLLTDDFTDALRAGMLLLAATTPLCLIVGAALPLFFANRLLGKRGCALIGEESADEFAGSKTLIFRDSDLFGAVGHAEIVVREGDDLRRDMNAVASLLHHLGGTLESLGEQFDSGIPDAPALPVFVIRIEDAGVEATVNQETHLLMGSAAFLSRSGVRVPRETTDKTLRRTDSESLTYIAVNGILKFSCEITYKIKPAFERLVADFASIGMSVAIRTYDPNITEELIRAIRPADATPIRVMKPGRFEAESVSGFSDSGAAAVGKSPSVVFSAVYAAFRVRSAKKKILFLQGFLSAAALGAGVLLTVLGKADLVTPLSVAGYQAIGMLFSAALARVELTRKKLRLGK